ncbi:hypothetical protein EDB87DRAFT_1574048 [Lactarius vividus]|nr:hypothetical protein EDB87DRAFT_1574048 [Lactarius vividus]
MNLNLGRADNGYPKPQTGSSTFGSVESRDGGVIKLRPGSWTLIKAKDQEIGGVGPLTFSLTGVEKTIADCSELFACGAGGGIGVWVAVVCRRPLNAVERRVQSPILTLGGRVIWACCHSSATFAAAGKRTVINFNLNGRFFVGGVITKDCSSWENENGKTEYRDGKMYGGKEVKETSRMIVSRYRPLVKSKAQRIGAPPQAKNCDGHTRFLLHHTTRNPTVATLKTARTHYYDTTKDTTTTCP